MVINVSPELHTVNLHRDKTDVFILHPYANTRLCTHVHMHILHAYTNTRLCTHVHMHAQVQCSFKLKLSVKMI